MYRPHRIQCNLRGGHGLWPQMGGSGPPPARKSRRCAPENFSVCIEIKREGEDKTRGTVEGARYCNLELMGSSHVTNHYIHACMHTYIHTYISRERKGERITHLARCKGIFAILKAAKSSQKKEKMSVTYNTRAI